MFDGPGAERILLEVFVLPFGNAAVLVPIDSKSRPLSI
jgi:hypothetical protein